MKTPLRIILLVALASLCAVVQGLLVDAPVPAGERDPYAIDLAEAEQLEAVLWVDGRHEGAYRKGHLKGSVHLSLDDWDGGLGQLLEDWDPGDAIVVYCDGNGCESSRSIAERLRTELGVDSVYWLVGGWPALQDGGLVP